MTTEHAATNHATTNHGPTRHEPAGRTAKLNWAARVEHAREVRLAGSADASFWAHRLEAEGLRPVERAGRAQVIFTAVEGRWMGVHFRDLSFGIIAEVSSGERDEDGSDGSSEGASDGRGVPSGAVPAGLYFAQAFNSSRFFAFTERHWFGTPYRHERALQVDATVPVAAQIGADDAVVFRCAMGPEARRAVRAISRSGEECWEGPLFLPTGGASGPRRYFLVSLAGDTLAYAFDAAQDELVLGPQHGPAIIGDLLDSGFSPEEWSVRADATHARTKTYTRRAGAPGLALACSWLLALCVLVLAGCAPARHSHAHHDGSLGSAADEAAVRTAFRSFVEAWEEQDQARAVNTFSMGALALDPPTPPAKFDGIDGIKQWTAGAFSEFDDISIALEDVRVRMVGSVAWVTADYVFTSQRGGSASEGAGYLSMIFVRQPDGTYKSPLFHASPLPRAGE